MTNEAVNEDFFPSQKQCDNSHCFREGKKYSLTVSFVIFLLDSYSSV